MGAALLDDISQAQQERLFHIDFKLRFLGAVNRADLVTRFGIKAAAATRDLSLYKQLAPRNLEYDTRPRPTSSTITLSRYSTIRKARHSPHCATDWATTMWARTGR